MIRACLGGWCHRRSSCSHYTAPTSRDDAVERLCDRGHDGWIDGEPLRVQRDVGTWERAAANKPVMLQRAGPFDGLAS